MRFMVLVKASKDSEAGVLPSRELLDAMGKFNESLVKRGMMLAGDGLQSSAKGARLRWSHGKLDVIDGPFTETKELVAGYWIVQASSKADVIETFKHCPPPMGEGNGELEIRQLFEVSDFPPELVSPVENKP
jgi:hypothetical protein